MRFDFARIKMNTRLFVERLLKVAPALKAAYAEHITFHDELLSHVFLGDVTRYVVAEAAKVPHPTSLQLLLDEMEAGLKSGDNDVAEMIGVSFVENLCGEDETLRKIVPMMGPELKREVKVICGFELPGRS